MNYLDFHEIQITQPQNSTINYIYGMVSPYKSDKGNIGFICWHPYICGPNKFYQKTKTKMVQARKTDRESLTCWSCSWRGPWPKNINHPISLTNHFNKEPAEQYAKHAYHQCRKQKEFIIEVLIHGKLHNSWWLDLQLPHIPFSASLISSIKIGWP